MAYTISHLYKKVLEGSDKMGGDFYTVPYVMNRLETATYDFIGETVKYIENTQEIRDDIETLYEPLNKVLIQDPNDPASMSVALPNNYLHLMSAKVIDPTTVVRMTRLIRHGQEEIFEQDPNTMPSADYPSVVIYSNLLKILSPGSPTKIVGMYVRKPNFGNYTPEDDIETEIAVDLPDNATEKIIKTIINDIFIAVGDPRAQGQFISTEAYRKRGNKL